MSGTVRLYDIDERAAKNNEIIGNRITAHKDAVGKWDYLTCRSLEEALSGCDFVIISILPGTFDEMYWDVHLPERLGIYQSVGDTTGPGGIIRALRTIPMFVTIAEAIKNTPQRLVINYTNPMSLALRLHQIFPQIKPSAVVMKSWNSEVLANSRENLWSFGVDRHDIHVNVLGINHFTWFDQASYKGIDLFPVYEAYIKEHGREGYCENDNNWANNSFECAHLVKFDLFKRYGLIAAAGDRHLAEFMPGDEYLNDPATVRSWKFGLTTVDWRKDDLKKRLERSERLVSGEEEIQLKSSGEEGVLLIQALCGLKRIVSNVNIPNTYLQIANLPANAVVETNAVFSKDSITPVFAGKLPEEIRQLIMPHIENHIYTLEAALTYKKDLVVKAFLNDPWSSQSERRRCNSLGERHA